MIRTRWKTSSNGAELIHPPTRSREAPRSSECRGSGGRTPVRLRDGLGPKPGLPGNRPGDTLERQVRFNLTEPPELYGLITAATYELLVKIREFDAAELWAGPGLCSCAHWLNWQCGIGMNAAREKVRVAHALAGLPKIAAVEEKDPRAPFPFFILMPATYTLAGLAAGLTPALSARAFFLSLAMVVLYAWLITTVVTTISIAIVEITALYCANIGIGDPRKW